MILYKITHLHTIFTYGLMTPECGEKSEKTAFASTRKVVSRSIELPLTTHFHVHLHVVKVRATYIKMTIVIHENLESRIGWIEIFARGTPCLLKSRSRYRLNENDVMPDKSQRKTRYTIENI